MNLAAIEKLKALLVADPDGRPMNDQTISLINIAILVEEGRLDLTKNSLRLAEGVFSIHPLRHFDITEPPPPQPEDQPKKWDEPKSKRLPGEPFYE